MMCQKCGGSTAVTETRVEADGVYLRRRRACDDCGYRFNTYEVAGSLTQTLRGFLPAHVRGTKRNWAKATRDKEIVRRVKGGEKRFVLAMEYGLSDNMVTHITRKAGIPAYSRAPRT